MDDTDPTMDAEPTWPGEPWEEGTCDADALMTACQRRRALLLAEREQLRGRMGLDAHRGRPLTARRAIRVLRLVEGALELMERLLRDASTWYRSGLSLRVDAQRHALDARRDLETWQRERAWWKRQADLSGLLLVGAQKLVGELNGRVDALEEAAALAVSPRAWESRLRALERRPAAPGLLGVAVLSAGVGAVAALAVAGLLLALGGA